MGEDYIGTLTCDHLVTTLADVPVYGDRESDIQPTGVRSIAEAARVLNKQASKHDGWNDWTVENGQLVFGNMPDAELTPNVDGMYHITSEEDWDAFAAMVDRGADFAGDTVILETDITVTQPVGGFSSVQANDRPFCGTFDGRWHTLTLAMETTSGSDRGAFSHTEGAVIRDLTVNGAVEGDSSVGGIVGNASNTAIENCTSNAAVTGHNRYIGGLAGYASDDTTFTNCENNAAVNGTQAVGGMAGLADNGVSFINCINNGSVSASANDTGGIVGFAGDGTYVLNCINTADITAKKYVGGILGNAVENAGASVTVDNCINYGNITALSGGDNAGGIVGHMAYCGEVKNCFTSGAVSKVGNSAVVIGWANRNCGGESLYYQELEVNEGLPDVCSGTDFPAGAVKPSALGVGSADDASMLAALNAYVSGHAADASGRSYWTVTDGRAWLSFSDVLVHTHELTGEYIDNDNGTHSRLCSGCGEYVAAPHADKNHNNICDECGSLIVKHNAPFLFSSKSLALESALAFRFYGYVGNEMPSDDAYMEFRIGDIRTVEVPFADAVEDSNGRYVFTCRLNVLEADEQIQATFHDGAATAQRSGTVSVSDYLKTVRSNHADKTGDADKAAVDLIDAIFDYAHYCQTALDYTHAEYTVGEDGRYRATESAHDGVPLMTEAEWKQFKAVKKLKSGFTDVKSSSRTLVLDDETAIVIYLTPAGDDYVPSVTVTKDKTGSPAEFSCEKQKDGRYRVIIPGIAAHQLADTFTVSIDGGKMSFTELSALSYAYSVFSADKGTEKDGLYKAAVSAMYAYYNAAINYRNCKK